MKYAKLGNSDLQVSRICMGCMGFGNAATGQHSWTVDEARSREIVRRGLELGVNFFDTAIGYQNGTSEEYLGRALKELAREKGYHFADVASVMKVEDGSLNPDYCSDPEDMGIHFTDAGAKVWIDYLLENAQDF